MPYPGLLHPELLSLWQATAGPYLQRRNSDTVLAQACGLGMCFVPFLGQSSLGNQVLGKCTVPVGLHLSHLPGPRCWISQVHCESTVTGVLYGSSGELISVCDPPGGCQPSRISGR